MEIIDLPNVAVTGALRPRVGPTLQEARYVIESVICDPNFEGLVLGSIEADFCN